VQTLIASLGGPSELALVLELVEASPELGVSRRASLLSGLVRASRQRKVRPEGDLARLSRLLDGPDEPLRALAAEAAGAWKVASVRPRLVALARAPETAEPLRRAALGALVELGEADDLKQVEALAEQGETPAVQGLALEALTARPDAPARAARWLATRSDSQAMLAARLVSRLLERREGPDALARELSGKSLTPDVARLCLRAARDSGRPAEGLIAAITRAGGLSTASRVFSPGELAGFLSEVARKGDPARGEAVFRRAELNCLKCHAIAGAGGQVGPGLESIGASAQPDYLVDSLLEPGKAVKENYHATVVATDDGRLLTGIRIRQTGAEIVLRDADDREVAVPLSSVEEQKPGGSLMPAGLTETLTRGEFADLVRFLSELGKIGPYSVGKDRVFRRWRVLQPSEAATRALARTSLDAVVQDGGSFTWTPAYATVGGRVPLAELPTIARGKGVPPVSLAQTQFEVSTPGAIRLGIQAAPGMSCWLDGRRVEPATGPAEGITAELPRGVHTLSLALEAAAEAVAPRVTLEDVPGSPARAQVVLGK
jgi:putative heme-binding domain-containing protein